MVKVFAVFQPMRNLKNVYSQFFCSFIISVQISCHNFIQQSYILTPQLIPKPNKIYLKKILQRIYLKMKMFNYFLQFVSSFCKRLKSWQLKSSNNKDT